MRPANQPLQRKDLPASHHRRRHHRHHLHVKRKDLFAHLVLACFRRRRHVRQSAALDIKTLNIVYTGKHVQWVSKNVYHFYFFNNSVKH